MTPDSSLRVDTRSHLGRLSVDLHDEMESDVFSGWFEVVLCETTATQEQS